MSKDPELTWDGAFPYDQLAAGGVTAASSMSDVQKAKIHFIKEGKMAEAHQAFVTLEKVGSRLLVDFFLYRISAQRSGREGAGG